MPGGGGDGGGGSTASGDHAPADVFIPAIADRIAAFLPPNEGAPRPEAACAAAASLPDGVARLTLLTGDMGLPTTTSTVAGAAGTGQAGTLRWLLARGVRPAAGEPPARVATGGHTEEIRFPPGHPYVTAAIHGDLLTLEALRRLGLPLGRSEAGRRGLVTQAIPCQAPLPALRWLRQAGCGVDWAGATDAVCSGYKAAGWRAEVLAWLQAEAEAEALWGQGPREERERYTWLCEAAPAAARSPTPDWAAKVAWLLEQDPSLSSGQPYVRAAAHGDLLALEALRRLGLPLGAGAEARGEALRASVAAGAPLEARRWLWDAQGQEAQALARAEAEAERAARAQAVAQAGPALAPVAEAEYDSGSDSDDDEEEDWAAEALAQAEAEAEAQAKSHAGAVAFVVVTAKGKGKAEAAKPGKGDGEGKAKGKGRAYVVRNWLRSRVQRALRALETA
ncbi:hypothetical protein HYH03_016084 [Edaphochlamys debaryana]|uniref:Uncharacterized protein n=1 Tax=Edaphochlamys debaryana TaxID=47281 RepID=A0A835XQK7_9CHLO|nr:hypothetical protein HYH03_016084 [Edaphochlamys debaryana]|eukprot:KAG2485195.1 hypothetical protein HYH03_016084 [Edaphochlamys debaryana]